jgi:hypothetical protein
MHTVSPKAFNIVTDKDCCREIHFYRSQMF